MASMPLALSVHNFINSVGADAGFAAVVGLAILVLLYFAHARETASLREQATALSQRLEEAESRLAAAQSAQQQAAAAEPQVADGEAGAQRIPAAPAGMAAPALAAATRFIPVRIPRPAVAGPVAVVAGPAAASPVVAPAPAPSPAPVPSPSPAPAATPTPEPSPAAAPAAPRPASAPAAPSPAPAPTAPSPAPAPSVRPSPAPATAPATAGPQGVPVAPAPITAFSRPAPATVAGGANGTARAPASVTQPPSAPPRRAGGSPPLRRAGTSADFPRAPGLSRGADDSGRAWRRFGLLVGILIVVGAAAAVVILTTGTGTQRPSASASGSNAPIPGGGFKPSHVTVAVLNGTATNQLAHHVADGLAARGYREGLIATASNQTVATTEVAYLPGRLNRLYALHVARALDLKPEAVVPIDQSARAVACPPPGTCTANVVVTVGSDLANS
jgi:hypothetical protein